MADVLNLPTAAHQPVIQGRRRSAKDCSNGRVTTINTARRLRRERGAVVDSQEPEESEEEFDLSVLHLQVSALKIGLEKMMQKARGC